MVLEVLGGRLDELAEGGPLDQTLGLRLAQVSLARCLLAHPRKAESLRLAAGFGLPALCGVHALGSRRFVACAVVAAHVVVAPAPCVLRDLYVIGGDGLGQRRRRSPATLVCRVELGDGDDFGGGAERAERCSGAGEAAHFWSREAAHTVTPPTTRSHQGNPPSVGAAAGGSAGRLMTSSGRAATIGAGPPHSVARSARSAAVGARIASLRRRKSSVPRSGQGHSGVA